MEEKVDSNSTHKIRRTEIMWGDNASWLRTGWKPLDRPQVKSPPSYLNNMAKSVICIPCNSEFPSEESFQNHKKSNHTIPGKPIDAPDADPPPAGIPPESMPTPEFMETVQRLESHKEEMQAVQEKIKQEEIKNHKPLELKYRWEGQDEAGHTVTTIEVEIGGKYNIVAYCLTEAKQVGSKEVPKING